MNWLLNFHGRLIVCYTTVQVNILVRKKDDFITLIQLYSRHSEDKNYLYIYICTMDVAGNISQVKWCTFTNLTHHYVLSVMCKHIYLIIYPIVYSNTQRARHIRSTSAECQLYVLYIRPAFSHCYSGVSWAGV